MQKFITKNTWIGLAVSAAILFLGLAVGALLISRCDFSEETQRLYLITISAATAFTGAFVAAKGRSEYLLRALAECALLYLLLWVMTLCTEGKACLDQFAVKVTAAVWGGGLLAGIVAPRKNRKQRKKSGHKPVAKRGKHVVT